MPSESGPDLHLQALQAEGVHSKDLGENLRAAPSNVKEDWVKRHEDELRQQKEKARNEQRSKKSRGNQGIYRQPIRNARRVNVCGGWQVKGDDPVAASTVFNRPAHVHGAPPDVSYGDGLKAGFKLLAGQAWQERAVLEAYSSGFADRFGQSTSGSTSQAGAADDAPEGWRGQPLAPPAEEAHYSLLRHLIHEVFGSSNGSASIDAKKGAVNVEDLKVLAAKVAQLPGAPLPSDFESTVGTTYEACTYKATSEYFSKKNFAVTASFLLAASNPDDRLFEDALGLVGASGRALLPPPTKLAGL